MCLSESIITHKYHQNFLIMFYTKKTNSKLILLIIIFSMLNLNASSAEVVFNETIVNSCDDCRFDTEKDTEPTESVSFYTGKMKENYIVEFGKEFTGMVILTTASGKVLKRKTITAESKVKLKLEFESKNVIAIVKNINGAVSTYKLKDQ